MCGVIGFSGVINTYTREIIKNLVLESRIRGLHATGVTVNIGDEFTTVIDVLGVDNVLKTIDSTKDSNVSQLIAHTRYSTSDLKYNQPIHSHKLSVVHNGVITQSSPEEWIENYGYECKGRNDSELVYESVIAGNIPLIEFRGSSMAVIELHNNGELVFYRNATRPLWYYPDKGNIFVASTRDIFIRAFNNNRVKAVKCEPDTIYTFKDGVLTSAVVFNDSNDQQLSTECSKFYLRNKAGYGL